MMGAATELQSLLQLLVDDGPALPADGLEDVPQLGLVIDRAIGEPRVRHQREQRVQLGLGEVGEEHPPLGGRVRRQPAADGDRQRHEALGLDARHVEDLRAVKDRDGRRFPGPLRERLEVGAREVPRVRATGRVRLRELEDVRREPEHAPVPAHVAEVKEREEHPPDRRAREAGPFGELADRERGGVLGEGGHHGQSALEGLHALRTLGGHVAP